MPPLIYADIETAVAETGLMVRGGFTPTPDDQVPGNAATLILIGNAGPSLWQAFSKTSSTSLNPLDDWTKNICSELAIAFEAEALFPFDGPPYLPFQRWAQRCEPVHPSPIGPLIHPTYGLWHAYRAALVFKDTIPLPETETQPNPCETCADKPCLSSCPVNALKPNGYDVPACIDFVASNDGADCLEKGCFARRACPVGQDYIYEPTQAAFHMKAFTGVQRPKMA